MTIFHKYQRLIIKTRDSNLNVNVNVRNAKRVKDGGLPVSPLIKIDTDRPVKSVPESHRWLIWVSGIMVYNWLLPSLEPAAGVN